jgi:hypothetical protein
MGQETGKQPDTYVDILIQHIRQHQSGTLSNDAYTETVSIKHEGDNLSPDTELLNKDLVEAANSFKVENIIDIAGIIVAYPFYSTSMYYIFQGKAPHEVTNALFGNIGTLSAFIGFLCGISFTSAAGIPMKELLASQERENKLKMMGTMYQHIIRALVINDLHQLQSDDKSKILEKINKEITETEQALKQIKLQIARGHVESASDVYDNDHDGAAQNNEEIYQDIRTEFIYLERLEFLKKLTQTVKDNTKDDAKHALYAEVQKTKIEQSRNIIADLHRPSHRSANEKIHFEEVFKPVAPIETDNDGSQILNNYGVPAARSHYQALIKLIAEFVELKHPNDSAKQNTLANEILENTQLAGFFTSTATQTYIRNVYSEIPAATGTASKEKLKKLYQDILNKKIELEPYDDIFNNYGIRKSTSHYAILIDLIEKSFAHSDPGTNYQFWVAKGNKHLRGTVLENYFKNPEAKHLKALFARAKAQRAIYLEQRKLDPVFTKTDVKANKHFTHSDRQETYAGHLNEDILRKREEILFYENKLEIINPIANAKKRIIPLAPPVIKPVNVKQKISRVKTSKKAGEKHILLAPAYDTQVLTGFKRIWHEISHLGEKIGNFFSSILDDNEPNKALRDESIALMARSPVVDPKFSAFKTFKIKLAYYYFYSFEIIAAFFHAYVVYPWQTYLFGGGVKGIKNPFLFLIAALFYIPAFFTYAGLFFVYKTLWAIVNFPTLLITLEQNVDRLHMGARNLDESLVATTSNSLFKMFTTSITYSIKKLVYLPFLTVFELGFGFMYWVLRPFAKDPDVRKTARALTMGFVADKVDTLCDNLEAAQNWLDHWENSLDEKVFERSDLLDYFVIYLGHASIKLAYVITHALILPLAFINAIVTFGKRTFYSIPFIALAVYKVKAWLFVEEKMIHELAARKVDDVSDTATIKMSVLGHKFFVQPIRNTWGWFKTAWKEVDKKYEIHHYGQLKYPKTVKFFHCTALILKLISVTFVNFFIGIINSLMSFFKFAPLLTFISFSTSTIAAGLTLPLGFGSIALSAEVAGPLLAAPMVFEPANSIHDLYNNVISTQGVKENLKLRTPVKYYEKYIRDYLIKKLPASIDKDENNPAFQAALTQLERQAYAYMPRLPMGVTDVTAHLDELFTKNLISTDNIAANNGDILEQQLEEQDLRSEWSAECIKFHAFTKYGGEICANRTGLINTIENNRASYIKFLASSLATVFNVNERTRDKHFNYFLQHDCLDTIADYFYEQYKITEDFKNSSGDYQTDCKHAFIGFSDLVTKRFIKVASDERVRRSLINDDSTERVYYIDNTGAALPCNVTHHNGELTIKFTSAEGEVKKAVFKTRNDLSLLFESSPYLRHRHTPVVEKTDLDVIMSNFVYSQNNNHVDLNICMSALEKDFAPAEIPVAESTIPKDEISVASSSNTPDSSNAEQTYCANTRAPLFNICRYGPSSASAEHLKKVYDDLQPKIELAIN